jgi:hypothetical protein
MQFSPREMALQTVRKNPFALEHISCHFQNDREVVLAALNGNAFALRFASIPLRNDFDIVLHAVQRSGRTLEFASPVLRQNEHIVGAAIASDHSAQQFALCAALIAYQPNQYHNTLARETVFVGRGSSAHRFASELDGKEMSDGCVFME